MTTTTLAARTRGQAPARPLVIALLPMAGVVFVTFFVIGMAMPVLPLHVHGRLGQSVFVVGLVAGSQFAMSLLSRFWAGAQADRRGTKRAMLLGLAGAAVAGGVYLLSLSLVGAPGLSAAVLIVGRGVLGGAESFVVTGGLGWALALAGPDRAGRAIALMGLPMYAAFAIGAPVGSALYAAHGFGGIAVATILAPLLAMGFIARAVPVAPTARQTPPLRTVVTAVRLPGVGLALSSVGFGSVTIFIALLFAQRGWSGAWGAFTALGVCFILARVLLGHLPDRIGGTRVALGSMVVEAIGQSVVWAAPSPTWVFVGAGLTGLGYSLVYPSLGIEAVRRAPPESRALAMGAFTACLDLALGLSGPILGGVAEHVGTGGIFLLSAVLVLTSTVVVPLLSRENRNRSPA